MKIVVNHLTRMQAGYICVAGVDTETGEHVRPVLRGSRLRTDLLVRHGGVFDIAVLVDLGTPEPVPSAPEAEDHIFDPDSIRAVKTVRSDRFWSLAKGVAKRKRSVIFGEELKMRGSNSCAVDVGKGRASLGCLFPSSAPRLYLRGGVGGQSQIRMRVTDGELDLDLGVTDIRLYGADHVTPDREIVNGVAKRLTEGTAVILSMGLTRAFGRSPGFPPVHWLQVNNIHMDDDPAWQLG